MLCLRSGGRAAAARCRLSTSAAGERLALRSTSRDIFVNLAVEDWLYQHHNLGQSRVLLLYRNSPCVVVGRHQNPWTEAAVPVLRERGIALARRNSGGGTVYHDTGNINLSFLTHKAGYDRSSNLALVCSALRRALQADVSVNCRDDIVVGGERKVSGTAAKLGRTAAYHHCTLLVDVDTSSLHQALHNPTSCDMIESNATKSIKSPVDNLIENSSESDIIALEAALAAEFGASEVKDIEPTDENFPGLSEIAAEFRSWNWVFGKTPKFSLNLGDRKIQFVNARTSSDCKEEIQNTCFDESFPFHLIRTATCRSEFWDLIEIAKSLRKIV